MNTKKTNTPGKFARTLCDFLWGITHPLKLIRRLRDQQLRIKALRHELRSAYNEVEICKAESEKLKTSVDISLADLSWYQKKQEPALKAANSALGEIIGELTTEQAKKIYEAVAPYADREGFRLFGVAQRILGKLHWSTFAYEDNRGFFEDADGYKLMKYLFVEYDGALGQPKRNRWKRVGNGYEMCVDLGIDTLTPEYQAFEKELYTTVLHHLNVFEASKKEAAV